MGKRLSFLDFPSDLPRFGAVNPYGTGNKGAYGFEVSPKTRFARAAMYLTPRKFKPFNIDIDIPMTGDIDNREIYK